MSKICLAETESDIQRCYLVMSQLRTHLSESNFIEAISAQKEDGYLLAYLESENLIRAVAGFRISRSLSWGRFMYVDDLVSHSDVRSSGYGGELFDWLVKFAESHDCLEFHLDSGVQRFGAHRFYLKKGMDITCHHLAMRIGNRTV